MKEDPIKEQIISDWKNSDFRPNDKLVKAVPEAHYSYFGKRGVADLHIKYEMLDSDSGNKCSEVFEVKSHLEEPHKVMRQFNRMIYAFFEDESRKEPLSAYFELTIAPTEHNLKHLIDYMNLYRSLGHIEREIDFESNEISRPEKYIGINFRHPDDATPVNWQEISEKIMNGEDWHKMVKDRNRKVAKSLNLC